MLSSRSTSASAKISFSSAHSAGIGTPCGSKWPFCRDSEKPSAPACHAIAHHLLHRLDLVIGGGALLAIVAHHVVAHRRVADQRSGIDAQASCRACPCIAGIVSQIDIDGAQHLHRDRFDIGQEFGHALAIRGDVLRFYWFVHVLSGIPRLSAHWLDGIFRRLRKLAGLEACAAVLVTAEVLAMAYYQALRDATRSQLLRSLCARILVEEPPI